MKIGFSFGRCLRDIVDGKVAVDDVLVIIARTHMETLVHVKNVVEIYLDRPEYLQGRDPEVCHAVARELWDAGKIHQPRLNGAMLRSIPEDYIWCDVVPTAMDRSPALDMAWNSYRTLLVMSGAKIPESSWIK